MSKQPIIIITCDGGGAHAKRTCTVAAFRKVRGEWWAEIRPADVRRQYAEGKGSGIPELDALRHVAEESNQQLLERDGVPWGPNLDMLLQNPEQGTRDRLRLDCLLCRKRRTPNTVTITNGIDSIFDGFVSAKMSIVSLDLVRQAQKHVLGS